MSNSNVIDLRAWRDKPLGELSGRHFASTQETLLLLKAFMAVESPLIRGEIIRVAQDAALLGNINRPSYDEPYHETPKPNPVPGFQPSLGLTIKRLRNSGGDAMEWDPELLAKLRKLASLRRKERIVSSRFTDQAMTPEIKMIVGQWYTDELSNRARMIYNAGPT
jgi:hypothetical protein